MSKGSLSARINRAPQMFDAGRAARAMESLGLSAQHPAYGLLRATASNSAYLTRCMARDAAFLVDALDRSPEDTLAQIQADLLQSTVSDRAEMAQALRVAKRRAALLIALSDLGGVWSLDNVCTGLTSFADAALTAALRFALREQMALGRWHAASHDSPEQNCGLFFLAMGKYGAFELNYSSDIDFSCYFDPTRLPIAADVEPKAFAVRLTQNVVGLMQDITSDGYVFRCDLRMRPDAGSTQIAIAIDAAENYYEAMGQNWERAAMIKARACAGDIAEGEAYLERLVPFVWRKYLDFAAIEDIHSIKRQIHAYGQFGGIHVAGQNIKLGRGGIREIEFFAQTQQLIMGGRDPKLRDRTTLGALNALTTKGVVRPDVNADLSAAYVTLRTLEHRLQMIDDEQTHTVPKSSDGIDNAARFMGYADTEDFKRDLIICLTGVQGHYAQLFERSAPLSQSTGNLVFTGVDDDAETLETLKALGFTNPRAVAASVRGWHHGRVRATRSSRARERLTALMPLLLKSLGESGNPDLAFSRFDKFLGGLPSGIQVFELLYNNSHLLKFITDIVGTAPRLADHLARRPQLFDALTDPGFLSRNLGSADLANSLSEELDRADGYEAKLDACRRWTQDQQFRCGLQLLQGQLDGAGAGYAFTAIADAVIRALTKICDTETEVAHGKISGGGWVVVGLGKLGSREMTSTSDLDLIFVYAHNDDAAASDGPKPLQPGPYFARASQRLITALTVLTSEGGLFEVDMRLRPSGNKGPVAVSLQSFAQYQTADAWTWERMALTRARIIEGPANLSAKTQTAIHHALTQPRDQIQTLADVADMRARLEKDAGKTAVWDIKTVAGGLIDIEFIVQGLMLANAAAHPDCLTSNTRDALKVLQRVGALGADETKQLCAALTLYENVLQLLRLTVDGPFVATDASPSLVALLSRAVGLPDLIGIENLLIETATKVRGIFNHRIGPVSATL